MPDNRSRHSSMPLPSGNQSSCTATSGLTAAILGTAAMGSMPSLLTGAQANLAYLSGAALPSPALGPIGLGPVGGTPGSGLGGLTAAALLARAGRRTLVLERSNSVGGAASTYKAGDLVIEAALHETSDPHDPCDPKHDVLARAGVLDAVEWVPTGGLYEVRGGPVGAPFGLPEGFAAARAALLARFPAAGAGIATILGDAERIATGLGVLSRGRAAFRDPREGAAALIKLGPLVRDWRRSLSEVFSRAFGDNEAIKCALAANLAYYHDDPDTLWWVFFALAQGGYLGSGGRFIRGGSQRLSSALARAVKTAGGDVQVRRRGTAIRLDRNGRASRMAKCGLQFHI